MIAAQFTGVGLMAYVLVLLVLRPLARLSSAAVHRAAPGVAGLHRLGNRPAPRAVGVRGVPVGERDCVGEQAGVPVAEQRPGLAQPGHVNTGLRRHRGS